MSYSFLRVDLWRSMSLFCGGSSLRYFREKRREAQKRGFGRREKNSTKLLNKKIYSISRGRVYCVPLIILRTPNSFVTNSRSDRHSRDDRCALALANFRIFPIRHFTVIRHIMLLRIILRVIARRLNIARWLCWWYEWRTKRSVRVKSYRIPRATKADGRRTVAGSIDSLVCESRGGSKERKKQRIKIAISRRKR